LFIGAVEVHFGSTRVLAAVTADIVSPLDNAPAEGVLHIYVDFSPMASHFFDPTKLSDKAIALARGVERGLRDSGAVDLEALCIFSGKKVWGVRCDLHVLDHQGNLWDACSLAALAGLLSFRRPDVTVSGDKITVHAISDKQPIPLALHHRPVAITFAFFHEGEVFAVDPSLHEELVCGSTTTVYTGAKKQFQTLGMNAKSYVCKAKQSVHACR
jgi:exosome complex component RRP45